MSFGASSTLRFEDQRGGVRNPIVFWEKQADEAKKANKKFKYKGKEQKFPLRNKVAPPPPPPHEEPPQSRRKPASSHVQKKDDNTASRQKKSTQRQHKPKKETPKTAGTITLTQKEFDTILETIGQLAIEAEEVKNGDIKDDNKQTANREINNKDDSEQAEKDIPDSQEVALAKDLPPETPGRPSIAHYPAPQPSHNAPTVSVEPNSVPGLALSQQIEPNRANLHAKTEPSKNDQENNENKPQLSVRQSVLGIPTAHLTKAEKKRLEWERQRAESAKEEEAWSPWGRPGAGAPRRDIQGNIVASYAIKQDVEKSPKQQPPPLDATSQKPVVDNSRTQRPPPAPAHTDKPLLSTSPTRQPQLDSTAPAKDPPLPAAIRSSFTIGNAAPNEDRFTSAKERQRQEWLQELEKQREEQRQRKLSEREAKRTEDLHDTWADRFVTNKPNAVLDQQSVTPAPPPPSDPPRLETRAQNNRVNSAPAPQPANQPAAQPTNTEEVSPTSYLRGQNAPIDPVTLRELEEKRRKQHEHQEYIKAQIEEKERLRREERERRRREEQEEEERLRRERDQLDGQLQEEKQRQKEKEDLERQRLDALKQAMEQAQEVAEREKHEKRLRKLQNAGHDVTQLHANYQDAPPQNPKAKVTPRADPSSIEPSYVPGLFPTPRDVVKVVPSYVPGLDPSPRSVAEPPDSNSQPSHISNANTSVRREFGIQTDPNLDLKGYSRESTEIEYTGPILEKKKKVRVQSAPKEESVYNYRVQSAPNETEEMPKKKKVPTATLR